MNRWLVVGLAVALLGSVGCKEPEDDCRSGESRCEGGAIQTCVDGNWSAQACGNDQVCLAGVCVDSCLNDSKKCDGNNVLMCQSLQWVHVQSCGGNQSCSDGVCRDEPECSVATFVSACLDATTLGESCEDGLIKRVNCEYGCDADQCKTVACVAGVFEPYCVDSSTLASSCSASGQLSTMACTNGCEAGKCHASTGTCDGATFSPSCKDGKTALQCIGDLVTEVTCTGTVCSAGCCQSGCNTATYAASCKDDKTAVRCMDGQVTEMTCTGTDICSAGSCQQCKTATYAVSCKDDKTAVQCIGGKIIEVNCSGTCSAGICSESCKLGTFGKYCKDDKTAMHCIRGKIIEVNCPNGCGSGYCRAGGCDNTFLDHCWGNTIEWCPWAGPDTGVIYSYECPNGACYIKDYAAYCEADGHGIGESCDSSFCVGSEAYRCNNGKIVYAEDFSWSGRSCLAVNGSLYYAERDDTYCPTKGEGFFIDGAVGDYCDVRVYGYGCVRVGSTWYNIVPDPEWPFGSMCIDGSTRITCGPESGSHLMAEECLGCIQNGYDVSCIHVGDICDATTFATVCKDGKAAVQCVGGLVTEIACTENSACFDGVCQSASCSM